MGCGPGHVARYLHEQGAHALGIDLSPRMIERARQLNAGIEFRIGNMAALDVADSSWSGIAAFYSIIHIPPTELASVLGEFWRVLRPGGEVLLAFHVGDELRHLDTLWEHQVSLDFLFYPRVLIEGQASRSWRASNETPMRALRWRRDVPIFVPASET
jgi:SAM-dependent methyltransferase